MNLPSITIKPFGIHAILMEWPNEVSESILDNILLFEKYLKHKCLESKDWETVPAYNSLLLTNRHLVIQHDVFGNKLQDWYADSKEIKPSKRYLWRLPVSYDAEFGIDMKEVSEKLGKTPEEIIELHTSHVYTLYGIGFLPGFMYLGGLPKALELPRKPSPRLKVRQGAVGLAGKQTGIYPQESPGGWNIIGNCSVPMFDVTKEQPCFVSVGDKIQFYQISRAEYDLHKIEAEVGIYQPEKIEMDA
ncbi:5-oxoprolinase subunit PxpB [Costertonia aggregata]|uniref:5-oxoprolinase subunit PxpB n=1 Tax=Costertonia aggregata TaxID=343403 RepID=A0A7H9ATR3_9FLAO|nr:5-oxoprolinase subunit PxpB [Costertonia aggregata]QLG46830.1 5-oxoprolinase subunit PxpB [Costertonia aggregata]